MTENSFPLVSVVLPVYNHARYLDAAIRSILAQDYRPIEILVINDGSTDESAAVAGSYKEIRIINQPRQGPASARNRGILAALGEYIAFLDGDDLWEKHKLRVQMKYFREHPETECVTARIKNFADPEALMENPELKERLLEKDPLGTQALIVRKKVFEKVGFFDPSFEVGDDTDWFFRAKDLGVSVIQLPEYLASRRIHNDNLTRRLLNTRKEEMIRILKNSIDRRREGGEE